MMINTTRLMNDLDNEVVKSITIVGIKNGGKLYEETIFEIIDDQWFKYTRTCELDKLADNVNEIKTGKYIKCTDDNVKTEALKFAILCNCNKQYSMLVDLLPATDPALNTRIEMIAAGLNKNNDNYSALKISNNCMDGYLTEACAKCEYWNAGDGIGCGAPFPIAECIAFSKKQKADEKERADFNASETEVYPIIISQDRYGGTYSGGKWIAFNGTSIPEGAFGDDNECGDFWSNEASNYVYGVGETPNLAVADMLIKMGQYKIAQ